MRCFMPRIPLLLWIISFLAVSTWLARLFKSIITAIIKSRFVVKLVQRNEECLMSVAMTDDRSNDGQSWLSGVEVEALAP